MADLPRTRNDGFNGMVPIFDLTNSFTSSLASWTWESLIDEYNVTDMDYFTSDDFLEDWPNWMWWGLAICLALGVLFMIITPICGCCYCCCRTCCGCCQPQENVKKGREPPPGTCKSCCYSAILFVLAGSMVAAACISMAAIPIIQQEVSSDGIINDWSVSLETMEAYIDTSLEEVEQAVFPPFSAASDEVFDILEEMPTATVERIAIETGVDPALYDLYDYTQQLEPLSGNLTAMNDLATELETERIDMDTDLDTVRADINGFIAGCPSSIPDTCNYLNGNVQKLTSWAVYGNLTDTSEAATAIDVAVTSGLVDEVAAFVEGFQNMSNTINDAIADDLNQTEEAVNDVEEELQEKYNDITEELTSVINFTDIHKTVDDVGDAVDEYSAYVIYGLWAVVSLAFITGLLYLAGIPLGLFLGSTASKHGSNCILAGIAFTFIFSALFWLIVVLFLVTGGTIELTVCRHVIGYDESAQAIEELIRDDDFNLTIKEFTDGCMNDETLYTAFNMAENGFNITELLDLDNTDLKEELDKLSNVTIDVGDITVITQDVIDTVYVLSNATSAIDYEGYYTELDKPVTGIDLLEYAAELRVAADDPGAGASFSANAIAAAGELETIHADHVVPMTSSRGELLDASTYAESVTSTDLTQIVDDLMHAQQQLNDDLDTMISDVIGDYTDQIYTIFDDYTKELSADVENEIGRCRSVYDAVAQIVQGPCVYFLNPYNVLWFCLGWFMSFGLVAVVIGTCLVGIFRTKAVFSHTVPFDDEIGDYMMDDYQ